MERRTVFCAAGIPAWVSTRRTVEGRRREISAFAGAREIIAGRPTQRHRGRDARSTATDFDRNCSVTPGDAYTAERGRVNRFGRGRRRRRERRADAMAVQGVWPRHRSPPSRSRLREAPPFSRSLGRRAAQGQRCWKRWHPDASRFGFGAYAMLFDGPRAETRRGSGVGGERRHAAATRAGGSPRTPMRVGYCPVAAAADLLQLA